MKEPIISNNKKNTNIEDEEFSLPPAESILDHLSSGIFILDCKWSINYVNKSMEKWVGKNRNQLIGFNIWEALPEAVGTDFYYFYHQAMEERISVTFEDYYERTQEWLKVTVEPYNGGIIGYVTNITENKKIEETINHILLHDFLTGLPNRNMLNLQLGNELSMASKKHQSIAILMVNVDRFKIINSSLGHVLGDLLLKEVALRLQTCLEDKKILFRNHGNEFTVVLADCDRNQAARVATRILEQFKNPLTIRIHEIYTTLSIGISLFPNNGTTVETLIKHANFAVYQAQKAGHNTYEFYRSSTLQKVKMDPFKIEMELHKALKQNQFSLRYQPKIDLKTGYIVGVEALISWNHPHWGLVLPETFIRIAEETGLIIPIGEWVLHSACHQLKNWQSQGFHTAVSVNLSPKQFNNSNIVKTIDHILRTTGISPHYLEVEITESLTTDIEHSISTFEQLKKIGVTISIDDFGTGFSSLSYLQKLSIDALKIDQSFIQDLLTNPNNEKIVKTIISMAHNLNLKVVAEGVETQEQLLFLQQHLCDQGQGFFFCKPLSADELNEKLSEVQQVVKIHGIPTDIRNRLWYEQLLNKAKEDLQDTVRMQQGMIFKFKKINGQFVHTLCDGELLYQFGFVPAQVVGKRLDEFLHIESALKKTEYYQRAWEGEELVPYEDRINGIDYLASLRPIKKGGEIIEVIGSCVNITARKQAEEQLAKAEKLAVVGDLAAGVAHEIRNPLTSIKGFIQLLRQGLQKQEYFKIIFDELQRLDEILQEFINLAKPQSSKLNLNDLTLILQDVETLFQSEANLKNIQIFQEYHHKLPKILCDRNQIKQVFINLIKNSIEATSHGGTIEIAGMVEQENVLIQIIDNGIGISEERLKRLGEPFYSNKEKGTGLGLMLCFKIIKQHNGTIIVKSIENQGTTVEIRLAIKESSRRG